MSSLLVSVLSLRVPFGFPTWESLIPMVVEWDEIKGL